MIEKFDYQKKEPLKAIERQDRLFDLVVDYDKSIEDLIKSNNFTEVDNRITTDNFPKNQKNQKGIRVELLASTRDSFIKEVEEDMQKSGLRAGTTQELLSFLSQYPKTEFKNIFAIGQKWEDKDGNRFCAQFYEEKNGDRVLVLSELGQYKDGEENYTPWPATLLAVRE